MELIQILSKKRKKPEKVILNYEYFLSTLINRKKNTKKIKDKPKVQDLAFLNEVVLESNALTFLFRLISVQLSSRWQFKLKNVN